MLFIFKTFCLAVFFASLIWLVSLFAPQFSFRDNSWLFTHKKIIRLQANEEIRQKFAASRNNLSQIEILFPDSGTANPKIINLKLMDSDCRETLREVSLTAKKLSGEKPLPFRFEKISDSREKTYCLSLTSSGEGTNLKVYLSENPSPDSLFFAKLPLASDNEKQALMMRPSYVNNTVWQNISELNQRISQYKPWFFKHYFLYAIAFGFISLSIALIIILVLI